MQYITLGISLSWHHVQNITLNTSFSLLDCRTTLPGVNCQDITLRDIYFLYDCRKSLFGHHSQDNTFRISLLSLLRIRAIFTPYRITRHHSWVITSRRHHCGIIILGYIYRIARQHSRDYTLRTSLSRLHSQGYFLPYMIAGHHSCHITLMKTLLGHHSCGITLRNLNSLQDCIRTHIWKHWTSLLFFYPTYICSTFSQTSEICDNQYLNLHLSLHNVMKYVHCLLPNDINIYNVQ